MAQTTPRTQVSYVSSAPSGACGSASASIQYVVTTGVMYGCISSLWTSLNGGATQITGSGAANQYTYWSGAQVLTGDATLVHTSTGIGVAGATAAFPGFKRSGTIFAHRLADDSADGPISASSVTLSGNVFITNSAPLIVTRNSAGVATSVAGGFDAGWPDSGAVQQRQWLFSAGVPSATNTAFSVTEYTDGVFQGVRQQWVKGGRTLINTTTDDTTHTLQVAGSSVSTRYDTATNCASGASPAVCAAASSGSVAVPTGTNPTLVVNTTAVTANSVIILTVDASLGTKLGVTCNTTVPALYDLSARTAATSFTIAITAVVSTNPICFNYIIHN